jgi:hypothetical protein
MLTRLSLEIDTDCDTAVLFDFLTDEVAPQLLRWILEEGATRETTLDELVESCCVEPVEVEA